MSVDMRPEVDRSAPSVDRQARASLVVAVSCCVAYALFIVVPYYVNGLNAVPLDQVAGGAHDPKDLWPVTTVIGTPFRIASLLTLIMAPVGAIAVLTWAAIRVLLQGSVLRSRRMWASAVVLSVAFLFWVSTPVPQALTTWMLD